MPTYYESDGVYHDRQRCRRAHATGDRIRTVADVSDYDPCPVCIDEPRGERERDGDEHKRDLDALIDDGICPWCDDYQGEHVGRHASAAHPDAWAAYQEGKA